jgi:membrane protease YdiL (CAAX protease family)
MEQIINEEKQEKKQKRKPWKGIAGAIWVLLVVLGIQVIVSLIGYSAYAAFCIVQMGDTEAGQQLYIEKITSGDYGDVATLILVAATLIYGLVVLLWYKLGYVKKYTSEKWTDLKTKFLKPEKLGKLAIATIGCYGLALLLAGLIGILMPSAIESYNDLMGISLGGNTALVCIVTIIIAPIAEETAFRGIILRKLIKNNIPITAAIIIQAVAFGIFHFNIVQGIYVIPLALLLGYVSYKYDSILPSIFVHMINNFLGIALSPIWGIVNVYLGAVLMVLFAFAVLYITGKRRQTILA